MDLYREQVYLAEKMLYADNVFLVCEFNREYIRARFPEAFPRLADKIQIHHLGLDMAATPYSFNGRPENRLVAVGRFERLKGLHCLLEAVAQLSRRGRLLELELIGGGEEEERLRTQAVRLGIAERVLFRGWLSGDGVFDALQKATLLVHPSILPDAMPTVIKEAIAVGTPVIASNLAGIPEILDGGSCGMLVPPGDVAAMIAAIERLLDDQPLRVRYAAAGRAHAERRFDMWANGRLLAERLRATPRRTGLNCRSAI
jgi:glycosyltransferase involved in cell wall biosynthesis